MAQDRLRYLQQRLSGELELAHLADSVRAFLSGPVAVDAKSKTATVALESYRELEDAWERLWGEIYVELPDDSA